MAKVPTDKQDGTCTRCGAGSDNAIRRRIAGAERGYVNVFECATCGFMTYKEIPQQPAKA